MGFRPSHSIVAIAGAAVLALLVSSAAGPPRTVRAQDAIVVAMINNQYAPGTITIAAGSTVTWVNNEDPNASDNVHDVIADDYTSWSSDYINPGETYSREFDTPGTYTYLCDLHTNMQGTIVVQ